MIDLEEALAAYIECAEWSSPNWDDKDENDNPQSHIEDTPWLWSDELIATSRRELAEMIEAASKIEGAEWWTSGQFGHDFWLTRNGHGAGFWDRGQGAAGTALTALCKPYGEVNLFVLNERIHAE